MRSTPAPKLLATILIGLFLTFTHFRPVNQSSSVEQGTAPITGQQSAYTDPHISTQISKAIAAKISKQPEVAKPAPVMEDPASVDTQVSAASSIAAPESRWAREQLVAGQPAEKTAASEVSSQLQEFRETVLDGTEGVIRGVFVDGVLALPVIQQPENDNAFVSTDLGTATQFRSAEKNDVIGLLAHNYLSGDLFYGLEIGQEVSIIYGDGTTALYRIESINQYQKLNTSSLRSDMIDLSTGLKVTTDEVFTKFYRGDHKLTFQTCLEREGKSNWGLTFIVAKPVTPSAQ